jgi:hypothetical protein
MAGNLDPPSGPTGAASQMVTLEQIYDPLDTCAAGVKMTSFTEPLAGPGAGTMHSLDDITGYAPARGSVPDLVRRDDTIYVYSPGSGGELDGNVRRYRFDTDTWEDPVPVSLQHRDGRDVRWVDSSPILDDNGAIVLFYLDPGETEGLPTSCPPGRASCLVPFWSATEVDGSDGTAFVVDAEVRAEYWIYVHTHQEGGPVIRRAKHDRLDAPIPDPSFSTIINGDSYPRLGSSTMVESPGFAVNTTRTPWPE